MGQAKDRGTREERVAEAKAKASAAAELKALANLARKEELRKSKQLVRPRNPQSRAIMGAYIGAAMAAGIILINKEDL